MDCRSSRSCRSLLGLTILLMVLAVSGGCTSALATAMWLIKGPNIPAEFPGLRGQRVVVVCRPLTSSLYTNPHIAKDISRQIASLLKANVRGIKLIDQRRVDEWIDENTWDEYTEIGNALEADLVVGIDLESFSIYQSQTLFQGKANFVIKVVECKTGETVFEKYPPQTIYPPNHVVSTQDVQEGAFRREFVRVVADQIARHFYPHDPRAYFAMDSARIY